MRVVLVGATSSIGGAVRERFLDVGATVLLAGSADVDLTDGASIERYADRVRDFAPVDVLLLLAGLCPGKPLADYADGELDEVLAVNVAGPAKLIRALRPHLGEHAQVLLVSSISGARGSFDPVYAASKGALSAFVRSMASWTPGVRFNAVAPGLIEGSAMWERMPEARREQHIRQTPTGRLLSLREIAGILVQLTGPAWASLNGQVIAVDGGR